MAARRFEWRASNLTQAYIAHGDRECERFLTDEADRGTLLASPETGKFGGVALDITSNLATKSFFCPMGVNFWPNGSTEGSLFMAFIPRFSTNAKRSLFRISGANNLPSMMFYTNGALATSVIHYAIINQNNDVSYSDTASTGTAVITQNVINTFGVNVKWSPVSGPDQRYMRLNLNGTQVSNLSPAAFAMNDTGAATIYPALWPSLVFGHNGSLPSDMWLQWFFLTTDIIDFTASQWLPANLTDYIADDTYPSGFWAGNSTDPGVGNVRLSTAYTINGVAKTGTVTVPTAANTKTGVAVDVSDTGTYTGSDRWSDPAIANVSVGVQYKADSTTNNRTGTLQTATLQFPNVDLQCGSPTLLQGSDSTGKIYITQGDAPAIGLIIKGVGLKTPVDASQATWTTNLPKSDGTVLEIAHASHTVTSTVAASGSETRDTINITVNITAAETAQLMVGVNQNMALEVLISAKRTTFFGGSVLDVRTEALD